MKISEMFLICVFLALLVSACSGKRGINENELSDYRPMIYVQDVLYGETADVVNTLPHNAISIGTVKKVVSQNEPMIRENFTSNLLAIGSEIYYDESDPSIIYVKLSDNSKERYSIYETLLNK